MADPETVVPYLTDADDAARRLLAAADELGLGHEVVRTTSAGFVVPTEVYEAAWPLPDPEEPKKPKNRAKKSARKRGAR